MKCHRPNCVRKGTLFPEVTVSAAITGDVEFYSEPVGLVDVATCAECASALTLADVVDDAQWVRIIAMLSKSTVVDPPDPLTNASLSWCPYSDLKKVEVTRG